MSEPIEHGCGWYRPCVGIMLVNSEGKLFAGQRIDRDEPAWQAPQGGIDKSETPRVAAFRELQEEIGVGFAQVELLRETSDWVFYDFPDAVASSRWSGRFSGQAQKWFLMRLTESDDAINIATDHPEFSEWRWMGAQDLLDAIIGFKRDSYRAVLSEFGLI